MSALAPRIPRICPEQSTDPGTPDSQDLCFVPDGDYAAAADRISGAAAVPGPFLDLDGNVIGEHRGIIHYTIGQRRGLGQSFGDRAYVVRIDPARNAVVLGPNAALFTRQASAVLGGERAMGLWVGGFFCLGVQEKPV